MDDTEATRLVPAMRALVTAATVHGGEELYEALHNVIANGEPVQAEAERAGVTRKQLRVARAKFAEYLAWYCELHGIDITPVGESGGSA